MAHDYVIQITILILAGIFNALMDLSADGKLLYSLNKANSWKNKWKNGDPKQGERFKFSSTIFVWTTDFWHFIQFCFHSCWQLIISLNFEHWIIMFIIIKAIFSIVFEITYRTK